MDNDAIMEIENCVNSTTLLGRVLERDEKIAVVPNVAPQQREALAP
ncbi:MAG: hypothetical protein ACK4Y5_18265 [Acetobacteraceae bacterium]